MISDGQNFYIIEIDFLPQIENKTQPIHHEQTESASKMLKQSKLFHLFHPLIRKRGESIFCLIFLGH